MSKLSEQLKKLESTLVEMTKDQFDGIDLESLNAAVLKGLKLEAPLDRQHFSPTSGVLTSKDLSKKAGVFSPLLHSLKLQAKVATDHKGVLNAHLMMHWEYMSGVKAFLSVGQATLENGKWVVASHLGK